MKKFEMLNVICKDCELTSKEKLVAQYFVYKSNKAGVCYPCVATIAEECCISRRTVQRATKKLAEKEYIMIEKQFKCGKQTSNLYSFNILLFEEMEKERIQEEEKAIEPTMEVVDLEELLSIQETVVDAEEENEEIDLDDLVASSAGDSVWEEAYDAPFEAVEYKEVYGESEAEQRKEMGMTEKQAVSQKSSKGTVYPSVTVNVLAYMVKCCEIGKELYSTFMLHSIESKEEELPSESSNGASIKIMGAFFPP